MRRVVLLAVVGGAILVPATAASGGHHASKLPLALVPLQTAHLGLAGKSLKLDYGSGPKFIRDVGLKAFDVRNVIGDGFRAGGGVARYALDYGDPFTGSTGVMEIRTGVEEYKTPADAKKGFALWRHVDSFLQIINPGNFPPKKLKAPPFGQQSFAYLRTWAAPHLNPIVSLDEQVVAGKFVLDLTVTAGSASAAKKVAPHLLRVLYHRFQLMLKGHLAGKPAKLPPKPHAGQAPSGPDLSTMILQPSDVGQSQAADLSQHYVAFPPALSEYAMVLHPAGPYDGGLGQQIFWWPTATEATYAEAYLSALFVKRYGEGSAVDVSLVGDNATGSLVDGGDDGSEVAVTLTNGQAGEFIVGLSTGAAPAPTDSDVQSLAQAAANRLDAGLP